jgi:hypothetical protein
MKIGPQYLNVINLIIEIGTFLMIVIGFASNQWAVYTYECGCDSDCMFFIGPFNMKYTKIGKCGYQVEETDCDELGLSNDECDTYDASAEAANIALAICVLVLIYKIAVTVVSFMYIHTRTKTLWILMVIHFFADVIMGFAAFISAGQFDEVMDEFVVIKQWNGNKVKFDHGIGWKLMIGGGFTAWVCAILTAGTLYRGLKPNDAPEEPATAGGDNTA